MGLDPGNDRESGREPGVAIDRLHGDVTTMTPSVVTSASGSPMGREARVTSPVTSLVRGGGQRRILYQRPPSGREPPVVRESVTVCVLL